MRMKRIILVLTVMAVMAAMLVAMASAALAVPPVSNETGCEGARNNASHAIQVGWPSWDAQDNVVDPAKAIDAPGTQDNPGWYKELASDSSNCPN
jgi:hypothetical protein